MKNTKQYFTLAFAIFFTLSIGAAPFDSTYQAKPSETSLLKNANIYDGEGNEFFNYDVLIQDG
ncbi:amidohydrolase, partial [Gammaproteobacteria bacterium]|nr:amidohydrolase [Gammaproteobacteria bacterium]